MGFTRCSIVSRAIDGIGSRRAGPTDKAEAILTSYRSAKKMQQFQSKGVLLRGAR
jgi:hypothetical protein